MKTRSNSPRTCFLQWFLHSCIQYPRELDQGSTWAGLENVEDTPFRSVYKVDYRKAKTKKESPMKSTIPIESFHPFLPMKCSFHNNWTAGKTPFHSGCYSIELIYFVFQIKGTTEVNTYSTAHKSTQLHSKFPNSTLLARIERFPSVNLYTEETRTWNTTVTPASEVACCCFGGLW